ncbi:MAG TPA: CHAT domain-containing protein, partial [Phenylobacterium sp.]
ATVAERVARNRGLSDRCRAEVQRALTQLQALPDTGIEARQTAAMLGAGSQAVLAEAFTEKAVLQNPAVSDAGVVVLATHGILNLSSCFTEPALLASVGPDSDGLIEASEILDMSLRARLVVLSACETAGGNQSDEAVSGFADGGEALSGLARAFIYAGASSVLATHWKVDSETSSAETRAFLTTATQGASLAAALAEAQRKLYDTAETAHPFYWAPFVLIGDGATALSTAAPSVAQVEG